MLDMLFKILTNGALRKACLKDLRGLDENLANSNVETLITKCGFVTCIIERHLVHSSRTLMNKTKALVRAQKRVEK